MPAKRKRNLFDPASEVPFPLSRSKIECYLKCPRCFYMDRRLGIKPPGMPSMTINRAVDTLMKSEFQGYRLKGQPHSAFLKRGFHAVPLSHPDIGVWQSNFKGITYLHQPTNLLVSGAPDDVLVLDKKWYVLDFKGTSSKQEIVALDSEYRLAYKRQIEVYSWLLEKNGHPVGKKGFLLFANARQDRPALDGRLDFDYQLVEIPIDLTWIEPTLKLAKECLMAEQPLPSDPACELCNYGKAVNEAVGGNE